MSATVKMEPDFRAILLRKADESAKTIQSFFEDNAATIVEAASAMRERFENGGRLLVMGNGGSACDAEHIAVEFMHPIFQKRKRLPAQCLSANSALLTAVGNDMNFSRVFVEQLTALGRPADIALAISTSGMSANLIAAVNEARSMGMLTIAFLGKDGGRLRNAAEFSLCVDSYSIHRIQEAHTVLLHALWDLIHIQSGEDDVI